MIRGTTPTHTFHTDVNLSSAGSVYVTYKQGSVEVNKTGSSVTVSGSTITSTLTQADTLRFEAGKDVQIQIRAKIGTTAVASNIMSESVYDVLKDGEI